MTHTTHHEEVFPIDTKGILIILERLKERADYAFNAPYKEGYGKRGISPEYEAGWNDVLSISSDWMVEIIQEEIDRLDKENE
jgi:hypothetical protein